MVATVIDRLLADEDLRIRFRFEPLETLADLHALGFELTADEIDLFLSSNARIWFRTEWRTGSTVH